MVVESGTALALPMAIVRVVWRPRSSVVLLTVPAVSLVCLGTVTRATEPVTTGTRELLAELVTPVAPALGRIVDVALGHAVREGVAILGGAGTGAPGLVTMCKRELLTVPVTPVTPWTIGDAEPATLSTRGVALCRGTATGATGLVTTGKKGLLATPATSVTPLTLVDVEAEPATPFSMEAADVAALATPATELLASSATPVTPPCTIVSVGRTVFNTGTSGVTAVAGSRGVVAHGVSSRQRRFARSSVSSRPRSSLPGSLTAAAPRRGRRKWQQRVSAGLVAASVTPVTPLTPLTPLAPVASVTPCTIVETGTVAPLVAAGTTAGTEVAGAEATADSDGGLAIEDTGVTAEGSGVVAVGAEDMAPGRTGGWWRGVGCIHGTEDRGSQTRCRRSGCCSRLVITQIKNCRWSICWRSARNRRRTRNRRSTRNRRPTRNRRSTRNRRRTRNRRPTRDRRRTRNRRGA